MGRLEESWTAGRHIGETHRLANGHSLGSGVVEESRHRIGRLADGLYPTVSWHVRIQP